MGKEPLKFKAKALSPPLVTTKPAGLYLLR